LSKSQNNKTESDLLKHMQTDKGMDYFLGKLARVLPIQLRRAKYIDGMLF
jgi:hypothetical protein